MRGIWTKGMLAVVVVGAALMAGSEGTATQGKAFACRDATLKGTFGIQMEGTGPGPGGVVQTIIGVVIRTYDGAGGFTQVDNIKGSATGIVPDRVGAGTYQVDADCTGTTQFQPGPGVLIEEKFVIVDRGDEIRSIVISPQPLMVSTVGKRVGVR